MAIRTYPSKCAVLVSLAFLIGDFSASAQSPPRDFYTSLLEQAVEAIDGDYREYWAYTETVSYSKGTSVGRFDPRRAESSRWQLMSIDGREPKAKDTKKYLEGKKEEEERPASQRVQVPMEMTEPDSLSLIEESATFWRLSFTPTSKAENADFVKYLDGELKILKEGPHLEYIDIRSNSPFKPKFTVKVREFASRYVYAPVVEDGPHLLRAIDFEIDIRAVGVLNVREKVAIEYSDYEYVGD